MNNSIAAEAQPLAKKLSDIEKLTSDYAKFSRDARGLGHVLGAGLVFLAIFLLPDARLHAPLPVTRRLLLCAMPVIWIVGKQWLQEHCYQFIGTVVQRKSRAGLVILGILTAFVGTVNLIVCGVLAYQLARHFSLALTFSTAICIVWLLVMPVLVWKYLRAPYEFMIGIFLLSLPALLLGGPLFYGARIVTGALKFFAGLVAFIVLFVGYSEHTKFLRIRRKLAESVNRA